MSDDDVSISKMRAQVELEYSNLSGPEAIGRFMSRVLASQETMVRLLLSSNEQLQSELESRRTNERLTEERRLDSLELIEKLMSQQKERDLQERKAEQNEKMLRQIIDELKPLLPTVVNRLVGKPLMGEKENQALRNLLATIKEEQWKVIGSVLDVNQTAILQQLMLEIDEPEEEPTNDSAETSSNGRH